MHVAVSIYIYALTVLCTFLSAVHEFGLPSQVRLDQGRGGENYLL